MKVRVYTPEQPADHGDALRAFASGCDSETRVFMHDVTDPYEECDIAVVFGVGKDRVPVSYDRARIINEHRKRKKSVIIIEKGFVDRDRYFAVGLNGLNGQADFRNRGMPPDRAAKSGFALQPLRETGRHILVIGQIPWDANVQDSDHSAWCRGAVDYMLGNTDDRIVIFRPHPLAPADLDYGIRTKGRLRVSTGSLANDLRNCHAVITFSSNTGVDAMVAGIPVIASSEMSMVWNAARHNFAEACDDGFCFSKTQRLKWWNDINYAQWNLDEIADGDAWRHLMRPLDEKHNG